MPDFVLIPKKDVDAALAVPSQPGARLLEPVKALTSANKVPFNIQENTNVTDSKPELHLKHADLWHCISGELTFLCGGTIVNKVHRKTPEGTGNPNELTGDKIEGGTNANLKPGDWLWIPAGVPHQMFCPNTSRTAIIKVLAS